MKISNAMYQKFLLRSVMCVFLLSLMLVTTVTGCAKQTGGCSISITAPSDANGPVTPGHSFFISGTIDGGEVLPENTTLRVSVFNEAGEEMRFAECSEMNRNVLDRFCSALFYYADDVDPEREDINAWNFLRLIPDLTFSRQAVHNVALYETVILLRHIDTDLFDPSLEFYIFWRKDGHLCFIEMSDIS